MVERGKRQTVRQVAYVHAVRPDGAPTGDVGANAGAPATPALAMPSASGLPSREQTGRVMAIVVDDLRMSFRSTVDVRTMLNRYVDRQLRPGNLVAIIRTAGGAGALQQFTTNRRLLKAATERVRGSARVWPFDPFGPWEGDGEGLADRFEREVTLEGSLGALAYAVRGVQAPPGRKTVVFVSEGVFLAAPDTQLNDAMPYVDHVIDTANRGGVVIYAIDPRGLVNPTSWLSSPPSGEGPTRATPAIWPRGAGQFLSVEGAVRDAVVARVPRGADGRLRRRQPQRPHGRLARIGADTRGYYLIGFDTAIAPGVRVEEGEVKIRVKRKDLQVRARRDRFGPADPDAPPPPRPADPLLSAALSPFTTGTLDVRLAALFGHDATEGDFVRALVAVDPAGVTLAEAPGGGREGNLTLLVFALDDEGDVVGQTREVIAVRLDADAYTRARQHGLRYASASRSRRRAATRSARPSSTSAPRPSARARSSSRCRAWARAASPSPVSS